MSTDEAGRVVNDGLVDCCLLNILDYATTVGSVVEPLAVWSVSGLLSLDKVCADYKCLRTHASASVQDTGSARDEPTMPILPTIIARVGEATRLTGFTVHRVPVRGSTMASTWRMYAEGHCWLRAAVMVLLHY
ncbi:hypothetical protein PPTG_05244 [Phytophthora nicotianae INRA-310]|uniref:Uncharacterized protein n=1 Tax=Phytophthora nicotianae (strain INRA-310) TaxID=761204 RepID=W2QW45_PHYN3|nr:hypothetical protein PPTG_05244 [Phytophthora nicotianae INRA-310]ETN17442.1 hypothetical protein PPTG_05244 [Phytophthora nicotianae INRA-310]